MTEQEESARGWNAKRFKYAIIIVGCVGLAGFLNQFAPGPAAEDAYAHGNTALKDQKYQEAADAFSRVVQLDPDNGPGQFRPYAGAARASVRARGAA
jgi:hypothetical protein